MILSLATFAYSLFFSVAGFRTACCSPSSPRCSNSSRSSGRSVAAIGFYVVAGLSGYGHLLVLAGFIGLYRLFQDYVLNPTLMSGGVALPPLLVLFGLLAGEELAGVAGIFRDPGACDRPHRGDPACARSARPPATRVTSRVRIGDLAPSGRLDTPESR